MAPSLRKENKHSARSGPRQPPPLGPVMLKDRQINELVCDWIGKENSISINAGQVAAEKREKRRRS